MRVLVTGAASSLGAAIVADLLAAGDVEYVLAVDAVPVPCGADPRLGTHGADLRHARAVHDLCWGPARAAAIDAVVHVAPPAQHASITAHALVLACAAHPTIRRLVAGSTAEVYALPRGTTSLLDEDAPLEFGGGTGPGVRARVAADTIFATRRDGALRISVLRCAELIASGSGGQLGDYLASRVCLRPVGFDPMINALSLVDAVAAFGAALRAEATGIFNIPGADTLPLRRVIADAGRRDIPLPAALLAPLYAARRALTRFEFRYEEHAGQFHVGGVLDGSRAHRLLGYTPRHPVRWAP